MKKTNKRKSLAERVPRDREVPVATMTLWIQRPSRGKGLGFFVDAEITPRGRQEEVVELLAALQFPADYPDRRFIAAVLAFLREDEAGVMAHDWV